jgi:hypothetical protein
MSVTIKANVIVIKKISGHRALLPDLLNALPYLTGFGVKGLLRR